jgi:hypothetical protein
MEKVEEVRIGLGTVLGKRLVVDILITLLPMLDTCCGSETTRIADILFDETDLSEVKPIILHEISPLENCVAGCVVHLSTC